MFTSLEVFPASVRRFYWWLLDRPHILDLPPEVLEIILLKVANNSYTDLVHCKKVCVAMRDVVQGETFYRSVDLFNVDTDWPHPHTRSSVAFNRACVDYGNPSALFMLGTWDFFRTDNMEEGLSSIQLAAERGYDLALYAYTFLTRIMFPGVVFNGALANISRELVRSARRKVQASSRRVWNNKLPPLYVERVSQLEVYPVELFRCPCNETYGLGEKWYNLRNQCDVCFWKSETLAFHQEFPQTVMEFLLEYPEDAE